MNHLWLIPAALTLAVAAVLLGWAIRKLLP
jgi:hypothetical protein